MIFSRKQIEQIIKLAIPVSIGQLGHIMMGVVDSLMVGKLGAVQLAASSLANSIFFLIAVIGLGLASAITPLVAIAEGEKNKEKSGIILREGFFVNFIFSILFMLILITGANFLQYLNQPPEVIFYTKSYLKILAYSIVPMLLFQNHRMYLEGLSLVKPPMVIAVVANIFNALFNWVLIFGNLGFESFGLDGAGWSTFFTRLLMAVAVIFYVHTSKLGKSYLHNIGKQKPNVKVAKKIVTIGLPSGFQYFFEVAAFSFSAILIGWIGTVPLAAHQIALNLASVSYMVILGISSAGTIKVARGLGQKNLEEIRTAGFSTLIVGGGFMFCSALLFILLKDFLPQLYISDKSVIELAANLLIVTALFQVFDGLQACGLGILRGLKDVKIPMLYTLAAYWLIGIPIGYLLGFTFNLGTVGVWIGLLVGLGVISILFIMRFNKKSLNILS